MITAIIRYAYYNKIKANGLAVIPDESETADLKISEQIEVSIEELEFKFGVFTFKYKLNSFNSLKLDFEIENINIRPEFTVLKPYFIKFLKKENATIHVKATFQNKRLVFKSASSNDLDKLNREVIDSLRFRFVDKAIIKGTSAGKPNLLNSQQLQGGAEVPLYTNEEELLENILSFKNYKHHRHLRHLCNIHESGVLKLRFVLEPFSFVFLISGISQYHIVWETLDTEEATYIWHIEKSIQRLSQKIKEIDLLIGRIRTGGRQAYLDTNPTDFSRILHDYSDDHKGFIIWKDLLEEKLF
jgi:hypothetical protein